MTIEVFFNKPKRPIDLSRLIDDIKNASSEILIASAWFTDLDIANAIVSSLAESKAAIFNASDTKRGTTKAYKKVVNHFEDVKWGRSEIKRSNDDKRWWLWDAWTLGDGDWQEGVMHHKFILVDRRIVWTGSYNFTFQARNNYETLMRIDDAEVAELFWKEVEELQGEWILFDGSTQFANNSGAFRCASCEKLYSVDEIGEDRESYQLCTRCAK